MYNVDSFPRFETRCVMFVPSALSVVRLFQQRLLSLIQKSMVECRDEAASVLSNLLLAGRFISVFQSVSISDLCFASCCCMLVLQQTCLTNSAKPSLTVTVPAGIHAIFCQHFVSDDCMYGNIHSRAYSGHVLRFLHVTGMVAML